MDYEVSRSPNFGRGSVIVRRVLSPNTVVVNPNTDARSRGVFGQVEVKTGYGIGAESRTIRRDKVDHAMLYRAYLGEVGSR